MESQLECQKLHITYLFFYILAFLLLKCGIICCKHKQEQKHNGWRGK